MELSTSPKKVSASHQIEANFRRSGSSAVQAFKFKERLKILIYDK